MKKINLLLCFLILIFTSCKEIETNQKSVTKYPLNKFLEKVDKEWHFVFKDTINGYVFSPDSLFAYIKQDSIETLTFQQKYINFSNDSLKNLILSFGNVVYTNNPDSALNLESNLLKLGTIKKIDAVSALYSVHLESSCMQKQNLQFPCNLYKAYLYTMYALYLKHKKYGNETWFGGYSIIERYYSKNKKTDKLIRFLELRSKNGSIGANLDLFRIYATDTIKSIKYLNIAAERDSPEAVYELAEIEFKKNNQKKALKHYIKAYELYDKQLPKKPKDIRNFNLNFKNVQERLKNYGYFQ